MSKFYGQVAGTGQTTASRRGFKNNMASVQSYDGSVIMELQEVNGKTMLIVEIADGSAFSGDVKFYGTLKQFADLLDAHKYEYFIEF